MAVASNVCRAIAPVVARSSAQWRFGRTVALPSARRLHASAVAWSAEPGSLPDHHRLPPYGSSARRFQEQHKEKQRSAMGASSRATPMPASSRHPSPERTGRAVTPPAAAAATATPISSTPEAGAADQNQRTTRQGLASDASKLGAGAAAAKGSASRWAKTLRAAVTPSAMKNLVKRYGGVAVCLHMSVFATTLGSFYGAIRYGVDIAAFVDHIPLLKHAPIDPHKSGFALAYAATLVTGPPRAVITLTTTPMVAKAWWRFSGQNEKAKKAEKEEESGDH